MVSQQNTYEFSLYNSEVRKLVEIGEKHKQIDDSWADQRYIQVRAKSEEKARTEASRRYPERRGYVFTSVTEFVD